MAISVYVARKCDDTGEFWSFVLEGEGRHVHDTCRVGIQSNSKEAFIDAYLWAIDRIRGVLTYENIDAPAITYFMPNVTMRRWLEHFVGLTDNGIKPPKEYYEKLYSLYTKLEGIESSYTLAIATTNRAMQFAKASCYSEKVKACRGDKLVDIMNDFED